MISFGWSIASEIAKSIRSSVEKAIEEQSTAGEKAANSPHPCDECGSRRNYRIEPELSVWVGGLGIAQVFIDDHFFICIDCGKCVKK